MSEDVFLFVLMKTTFYFADKDNAAATSKSENESIDPVVAYHSLQTVAFAFLAGIIMRLKLLFTPQLCVLSALLCNCKVGVRTA